MSREDRLNSLLAIAVEHGSVDVEEAAAALAVSNATIRRDLDSLAERQLVNRTHGGATLTGSSFASKTTNRRDRSDHGETSSNRWY